MEEHIKETIIEEEIKRSYIDYAMSVIVSRALPDVRDGLKPVHRRILYTMHELGLQHKKSFKKSARIVGFCLGQYHPHGDMAVYDALVRMAQDFSLRYPLIWGQGNFGSIDGDHAAAQRYTEAKLTPIAEEMLKDIDKDVVDFVPNFDNSLKEPLVLPSRIPNLLINGTTGIAVGMATNIPPHNIREVCDAIIATIKNPDINISEIMNIIKGPDFPTRAIIYDKGLLNAYKSGRGKITIKARIEHEYDNKKNRVRLVIKEIPYMTNKALLVESIADLVKQGKLSDIADLRDESDKDGIRIVIELKKGSDAKIVEKKLLKYTRLQDTFGINLLVLVNNEPKQLNIKGLINEYIMHRREIITRKTTFLLKKAKERKHIVDGLLVAINDIDNVITTIRLANTINYAKTRLINKYKLSDKQATAILDMRLQKLASLEIKKLNFEQEDLIKNIERFNKILNNKDIIDEMIIKDLEEIKSDYGDERRTEIITEEVFLGEFEEMIKDEPCVVVLSDRGYIKRMSLEEYKTQARGGKGIIAASFGEGDFVKDIIITTVKSYLLIFTNKGNIYWLKVYKIPEHSRYSKGNAIINYINLKENEGVSSVISIKNFSGYLFMTTKKGYVKKVICKEFERHRPSGKIAITLDKNDELVNVIKTTGDDDIFIATKKGYGIRFSEKDVRGMGRTARGVIGIKLKKDDYIVSVTRIGEGDKDKTLVTVTTLGYGKRTRMSEYTKIRRAGSGVINIKLVNKNGFVVCSKIVEDSDEIMIITRKGKTIKLKASNIGVIGRSTQGVKLIKLEKDDMVSDIAIIKKELKEIEKE